MLDEQLLNEKMSGLMNEGRMTADSITGQAAQRLAWVGDEGYGTKGCDAWRRWLNHRRMGQTLFWCPGDTNEPRTQIPPSRSTCDNTGGGRLKTSDNPKE
jgi:hypothetical protein